MSALGTLRASSPQRTLQPRVRILSTRISWQALSKGFLQSSNTMLQLPAGLRTLLTKEMRLVWHDWLLMNSCWLSSSFFFFYKEVLISLLNKSVKNMFCFTPNWGVHIKLTSLPTLKLNGFKPPSFSLRCIFRPYYALRNSLIMSQARWCLLPWPGGNSLGRRGKGVGRESSSPAVLFHHAQWTCPLTSGLLNTSRHFPQGPL